MGQVGHGFSGAYYTDLALAGCAKVGTPLPPVRGQLDAIQDLQLIQSGEASVLVTFPEPTPTGQAPEVQVFRLCDNQQPSDLAAPDPVAVVPLSSLPRRDFRNGPLNGMRVVFSDSPPPGEACQYWVRLAAGADRSVRSKLALRVPSPVPPAPTNLRVEPGERAMVLRWDPPPSDNIKGYLVNARIFVSGTEYADRDFRFGERKIYRVQSVTSISAPVVASLPSEPLAVTPVDRFPPSAPENVTALAVEGQVRVIWDANEEPDLAGYYVYRGRQSGSLQKTSPMISTNRYTETAPAGGTLYYRISAVDREGNEGPLSEVVRVDIN